MSLSIGIVGLPNVGKSTLFNALTKKSVPAENYPFCTIDPSVGIVGVPDERLDKLAEFSGSKKTIPAAIEFVDIAGLVEGASKGEGLGNKFLTNIREVDAILHMVRLFAVKQGDGAVHHVYGDIDPLRDIQVINMELILSDLETVEKRLGNVEKEVKRHNKDAVHERDVLVKIKTVLENEQLAKTADVSDEDKKIIKSLSLLTLKPVIYGLNKQSGEDNLDESNPEKFAELVKHIKQTESKYVLLDAKTEHELQDFDPEEKKQFKDELGAKADDIDALIRESYALLGLMTYLTTGPEESRAWTIKMGSTAPVAASAIHTDFEKQFIRAEVIGWDKLLESGSRGSARESGLLRLEGKEYIVQDGDVIEFKI
ncbi:MAG: redox-regulated ATPase YchF [Candidatus Nomurabacteria bacterium]|nr:redox-regulated ATPase YchF [Candidatus Nomurabacteria bacterium]